MEDVAGEYAAQVVPPALALALTYHDLHQLLSR
jgi:hypothetical protein